MSDVKKIRKRPAKSEHIIADDHVFVDRIFDLAMPLELGFEDNNELNEFLDCLYVMRVYWRMSFLVQRVESLNVALKMLEPRNLPQSFANFPLTRYEWLTATTDVFLMRLVSIVDCCILLTNEVFELGLAPRACTFESLRKARVPTKTLKALDGISATSDLLRDERNSRFHRGEERPFTEHDHAFRAISTFESWGHSGIIIDPKTQKETKLFDWFKRALEKLGRECKQRASEVPLALAAFFDELSPEFESRFGSKFETRTKPLPWYPRQSKRS